jgi:cytochrome P450
MALFIVSQELIHLIKEGLRMYPIVLEVIRAANQNDILPLSDPITLDTGKVLYELPIPKGTVIFTSIYGYNR